MGADEKNGKMTAAVIHYWIVKHKSQFSYKTITSYFIAMIT
jgi:hypothetical protein